MGGGLRAEARDFGVDWAGERGLRLMLFGAGGWVVREEVFEKE